MAKQSKNLVIVESPAKAKTIGKYLGKDYVVKASKGHVRDLPKKEIGVDIEHDFKPKYVVPRDRSSLIKELKKAAGSSGNVFLATDLDREGEAIAWHIADALGLDPEQTYRVVFNEITASAIREAFKQPGRLNLHKVDAQQARRVLDRIVGYKLSPLLWRKIRRGLSAGRVQSVAVRLVVEREREIEAFKPEEYWRIRADLAPAGAAADESQRFKAELTRFDGKKFRPDNGQSAESVATELRQAQYVVAERTTKRRFDRPPPPFITSELQRAASTYMRFSSRRTMSVAQQLYEGVPLGERGQIGLITYMRTDSHHVAGSALASCREFIARQYGPGYVPEKPNFFASRSNAQEAHEAIRPTDVTIRPEEIKDYLDNDQFRLYQLIWQRFVASQMKPAEWEVTNLVIHAGRGEFKAIGRTLIYDGHTKITGIRLGKDEQMLPPVEQGDGLDLVRLDSSQHFTQPPPRYSEATLIKELESKGIGRPSTYASILSTIEERQYVEQIERRYHATALGKVVTDKLVEHFPGILNVDFTRHMEEDLDRVEQGEMGYLAVMNEFYGPFTTALEAAQESMKRPEPQPTGENCPECGAPLVERIGRFGPFVGCQKYPECKYIVKTKRKPPTGEPTEFTCPKCQSQLQRVKSRKGIIYYSCSNADCGKMLPGGPDEDKPQTPEPCAECGSEMLLRLSRGEPFLGCSAYPKCKTTISLRRSKDGSTVTVKSRTPKTLETDIVCDKCKKRNMVVRMSKRGPFLACPGYPKCKNAKDAPPEWKEKFTAMTNEAKAAQEKEAEAAANAERNGDS